MLSLKRSIGIGIVLGLAATAVWTRAQVSDARPLPSLLPPGALLYLEAKDFHHLLDDWNGSGEKKRWLASKNLEQLSVSRLIQRLGQASGEFESVAGLPLGMSFTDQVAGNRSGFALYDFSQLAFVYITQMPQSRLEGSELWRRRTSFQTREEAGIQFFVKADEKNGRKVAFAAYKEWFVVATDESRLAQTLLLISGAKAPSLASEEWFSAAAAQRTDMGDLRLVYNMESLLRSPQYRTYWLHRNASELRPFRGGVVDLFQREDGFAEERVMLRKTGVIAEAPIAQLAEIASFAPRGGSTLTRAWSSPDAEVTASVTMQVIFAEDSSARVNQYQPAPMVSPEAGSVGSESDLEIRIDEPPFDHASQRTLTPLLNALAGMQPVALAHFQVTSVLGDQVFVLPQSGMVLYCQKPDRAALDRALAEVVNPLLTGSLDPLTVAVTGQLVTLTRVPLERAAANPLLQPDASYFASYDHRSEWPRYKKLFAVLDDSAGSTQPGIAQQGPSFFSGNLGSLGDSLSRLQRASIVSSDRGASVRETLHYQLARP